MSKRKSEEYYKGARSEVCDLVSGDAQRVLDVGCAYGMNGRILKQRGVKEVIGVEIDPKACEEASKRLDVAHCGDIQNLDLPYKEGYFDCIIYADVLEHLNDPWSLLRTQRRLVKDDGYIVASIPNVAHYRVVTLTTSLSSAKRFTGSTRATAPCAWGSGSW